MPALIRYVIATVARAAIEKRLPGAEVLLYPDFTCDKVWT